ncbi:MAG TPA: extracellular solute-binding protein [Geminicoccus sp.]|uniref:extracellular solute-binding protein n=1 Tax=Geminicoccus sp. TaxID=2024832 RepID=UPI002CFC2517|nr:extracellular solute-binding protein [Geminicoccus sp.]HWL70852.1 extracellular solute-binding protein [Geminicoccus sp.]
MTGTLRIAVRKFDAFENAIVRQFQDFAASTGTDVRLEIEALELNPMHQALFVDGRLLDGSFDLTFLATDWLAEAQGAGLITDLSPFLEQAPPPDFPNGWSPSLLGLQRFAGGFWGMPYHDGPQCLIYRKDLLEAAGLAVPTTWEEFHQTARRLHDPAAGHYGTVLALFPDGHNGFYDFCVHVWTRGGEPFDGDARPDLVTPEAEAALDFIRTLAADGQAIAPDCAKLDSVQSGILFCAGKVALMTNWFGFAALGETWADSRVKGLVDIAPLPRAGHGRSLSLNVFWVLAIAAGSRQKDLAWRFLRHLASPAMDRLTTLEGAIGVRRSTWADPEVNRIVPYYHKLDELHAKARELPRHPRLSAIAASVDAMLGRATTTTMPSRDLLAHAQQQILDILR